MTTWAEHAANVEAAARAASYRSAGLAGSLYDAARALAVLSLAEDQHAARPDRQ